MILCCFSLIQITKLSTVSAAVAALAADLGQLRLNDALPPLHYLMSLGVDGQRVGAPASQQFLACVLAVDAATFDGRVACRDHLSDNNISVATVYRTVRLFEESGILIKHEFGDGRSRYENFQEKEHHDHLIDIENGTIIEFQNEEIEFLQKKIAEELGFELIDHRLELYGRKKQ